METSISSVIAEPEVLEIQTCQHEWMIDSPNGPSSHGICHLCGIEKDFPNYIEGSAWGYDNSVSSEQINRPSSVGIKQTPRIEDEDA
jgi:hypothetical protein